MDLRGLDRFVDNPPGRAGNLYDTFGSTDNGIDETPIDFFKSRPSEIQCSLAATGGTNLCFQDHTLPRKELIPSRRIQFDPNIEDLREYDSPVPYIPSQIKKQQTQNIMVPVVILIVLILFIR
jgi:hypothetical protein